MAEDRSLFYDENIVLQQHICHAQELVSGRALQA